MTAPDLRLLGPAAAAWLSVAIGLSWMPARLACVGSALVVIGAAGTRLRPTMALAGLGLTVAATGLVLLAAAAHLQLRSVGAVSALAEQGASVRLRAQVASDPVRLTPGGPRREPLVMVRLAVREVEGRGIRTSVRTPVLAFGDDSWAGLLWGQDVDVRGRLAPARRGDDVLATLSGRTGPVVRGSPSAVRRAAGSLRTGLQSAAQGAPGQGAGLLPGLVLGDTSRLDPALEQDMRSAGLTHLVAVSGSNVAIVCGAVLLVAAKLGLPRRLRPPVAGLALVGFVIVARPEPSVLRAAVMGAIGLVGLSAARRTQGIPALSAAVLVLLVVDPWLSRSYGFALSVLATLGLLVLAPPWAGWLSRFMPRPLALALAVPLAAQAACGPVVVLLQGSVSLGSVPANLAAAPFVAPATILGVVAAVLSALSPPLAQVVAWGAVLPADAITWVAYVGARVPAVPWPGGGVGALSLALLTGALVIGAAPAARACARHPWAATAFVPVLAAGIWPTGSVAWPPGHWVMVMCDVGQGDGLVLNTGPGHALVVDTGPDPDAMDHCLDRLGVRVVDLLVLTHDHADHVEGVPGVLAGRVVRRLMLNGLDDPAGEARRVAGWAARAGLSSETARVGATGQLGPVAWQVLWPARVIHDGSAPNNTSIVLLVRSQGLRLLLLGDVETAAARQVDLALRAQSDGARVDVLKVAHHGSALQDPRLVQDAGAALALVSVGADNDYGHPAASTLALLRGTGAVVRRTDQDGDIAVVSAGGRPAVVTRG